MYRLRSLVATGWMALQLVWPVVAQPRWQPDKTMVLVVSLTRWPDAPNLTPSVKPRKDDELIRQFSRSGVAEDNVIVLQDQRATRQGIQQAITFLAGRGGPDSTLIIYLQGHGSRTGLYCFDFNDRDRGVFELREIPSLVRSFRGNRLILVGDSRCSGALPSVLERCSLEQPKLRIAALVSAVASNQSRPNWTYTQALIRWLAGDPRLDRNRDRRINTSELELFLHDQMKYRENQLCGLTLSANFEKDYVWTQTVGKFPSSGKGRYRTGDLLQAQDGQGKWWPAEVLGEPGGQYRVQLHDPERLREETLPESRLRAFGKTHLDLSATYQLADTTQAVSLVRSLEDYFYLARRNLAAGEQDEWVTADRLRLLSRPELPETSPPVPPDSPIRPPFDSSPPAVGDRVAARWRKHWYAAQVVSKRDGSYHLRYDDNTTGQVSPADVIPVLSGRPPVAGDRVLACASSSGRMLTGTVVRVEHGRATIRWDHQSDLTEVELDKVARIRSQD